jgi:glutamate carboxypeptidase
MAKTPAVALMADWAKELAAEIGFTVQDQATGGASDANNVAQFGIPVLDGLGPVGGLDHSPNEYIERSSIIPRTRLLGALLETICVRQAELKAV